MKLWLVRHAQVLLPPGVCYGASDVAADDAHTEQSAMALANQLPRDITQRGIPVRVSGLCRAQQMAQALCRVRPDLQAPVVDVRLNEMNFGHWELQAWDAIGAEAMDAWLGCFAHYACGGGETTQQVIDRVVQALEAQLKCGVAHAIWVTHAGVIRAVEYIQQHGRKPIESVAHWPTDAPAPGAMVWRQLGLDA